MTSRIAIVDDEPLLRAQLRQSLAQLWPEAQIVGEADNGPAALTLLQQTEPDWVFLDIRMPGMSGLEVARQCSDKTQIVFVTAYDQHAIEAFEHGAVDYLLKPADPIRLQRTIDRIKSRQRQSPLSLAALLAQLEQHKPRQYIRWIQASVGNTIHFITIGEVLYFQAEDKYTKVVTGRAEALIRKSIKELLEELNPENFWQVNRGIIIAVDHLDSVHRSSDGSVHVKIRGQTALLPVSQTWQARFRQM